jgi:hydrogenase maturation protease
MKTIIIGLGNPLLADDSVGIKVARILREKFQGNDSVEVTEVYAGGMRLLDVMIGYEYAIIIDALVTKENKPGRIHRLTPSDITTTWNMMTLHDLDLPTAMEMGKMLDYNVPAKVDIWGIEGKDLETFSEELTPEVAAAVPTVVEEITKNLGYG